MNIDKSIRRAFEYHGSGKPVEAEHICRKVLGRQPKNSDVLNLLGVILFQRNDYDSAVLYLERAAAVNPSNAEIHNNLGLVLSGKGQIDDAIISFKKALEINPYYSDAWNGLGSAIFKQGSSDAAAECYQKALKFNPNHADACNNFGSSLCDKGRFHEAVRYFQKAILVKHQFPVAHFNLSFLLLLLGDFKSGWREYWWRWGLEEFKIPDFEQPIWDGSDLAGKPILIHIEQGFGDIIQFVRYIPLVAGRGGKVILICHKELLTLMRDVEGLSRVIMQGEPLPEFDVHCPLLTLPLIFDTDLENIPAKVPYIRADSLLVEKWGKRIQGDKSPVKVGLAWAGNPIHKRDRHRSIALEKFAALGGIRGVTFYSLQKGAGAEQAKTPPEGLELIDCMDEVRDFSDTAALIENLDLVISVDSSVAHLAGAMGKPVWTLLPFVPDWRWLLNREDSPWYPTMRLFRQPSFGDWNSVIAVLAEELRALTGEGQM